MAKGVYYIKSMFDSTPTMYGEGFLLQKKKRKKAWVTLHSRRAAKGFLLQNKQENMDDRTPTMYGVWVPRRSTSTVTGSSAWRGARESWGDRAEDGRRGIYFSQFKRYLLIWITILLHHIKIKKRIESCMVQFSWTRKVCTDSEEIHVHSTRLTV